MARSVMAKSAEKSSSRSGSRSKRIIAIVRKMPKMSAAQNRRIAALLEKNKTPRMTAEDRRELRALLDLVDRVSYWNLASAIELEAMRSARSARPRARRTG